MRRWNVHLQKTGVASTGVVKKPTKDGIVISLELFEARGEFIGRVVSPPGWEASATVVRAPAAEAPRH